MRTFLYPLILLSFLLVMACSSDDSSDDDIGVQREKYIPISIYGNSGEEHTQVNISREGVVTNISLNDELQLDPSIGSYSTKFSNELIIFYSRIEADLGIRQKNLVTGDINIPQDFCLRQTNDSFEDIGSNGDVLYKVVFNYGVNRSIHLDVYDKQLGLPCSRIDLVNPSTLQVKDIGGPFDAETYEDIVLIKYYNTNTNEGYLTVLDLTTQQIVKKFSFDSQIRTAFIKGDDIYISTVLYKYQLYSLSDFSFKRELIMSERVDHLGFGLIHPNEYQNKIAAKVPMPQPSTLASIPAIIDSDNGNLLYRIDGADLFRLDSEIINEIRENLEFHSISSFDRFEIDLESETIVFAYSLSNTSGVIVFADYLGNVLSYVPVPVNPQRIILH